VAYPFVPAFYQFGRRKGPVLGFVVHMAEGGGTVGYLSRANPNHVSVHYVIEYDGTIVQMVRETDASGSINPRDVRTTDDPDGFFGVTANKAVLGSWWNDPNSAVISLEIEGFAKAGPRAVQNVALKRLVDDVRSRYPNIGLLGHRDFADYKACPGKLIPWEAIGGHGPHGGDPVIEPGDDINYGWESYTLDNDHIVYCIGGPRNADGTTDPNLRLCFAGTGSSLATFVARARLTNGKPVPASDELLKMITSGGMAVDCSDVVQAELERASVRASAAVLARP
jgi:hypothetical protein